MNYIGLQSNDNLITRKQVDVQLNDLITNIRALNNNLNFNYFVDFEEIKDANQSFVLSNGILRSSSNTNLMINYIYFDRGVYRLRIRARITSDAQNVNLIFEEQRRTSPTHKIFKTIGKLTNKFQTFTYDLNVASMSNYLFALNLSDTNQTIEYEEIALRRGV